MSPNRRRSNEPEESEQPDRQVARPRPDQRTLDALGNAVRRARESSGPPGPDRESGPGGDEPPPREVDITDEVPVVVAGTAAAPPPPRPATARPPAHRAGSPWYADSGRRRVRSAGALGGLAVAAVVVVVLVAIGLAHALSGSTTAQRTHGGGGPAPSSSSPATPSTGAPPSSATTTPSTTATSTTQPSSTTTTTTAPATGSGPTISSISPASGGAGSVVDVSGSNLFSSNGVVLARVDGRPSPTSCPTRSSCQVTIPDLGGGARNVPVTISTAAGTSNPLSFHYT